MSINCLTDTSSKRLWVKIKKENHLSEDPRRRGLNHGNLLRKEDPREFRSAPKVSTQNFCGARRDEIPRQKAPPREKNKRKKERKLFPLIRDCKPPRNYERIKGSLNKGIPTQILKRRKNP